MTNFKEIDIKDFNLNPFNEIGNNWALIVSESDGVTDAMTASWGGVGVMWGRNVVYVFVRESRYTKLIIDKTKEFSLSFIDHKEYGKALGYLGKVSAHDDKNKLESTGLSVAYDNNIPYIDESYLALTCKIVTEIPKVENGINDDVVGSEWFDDKDPHSMYVAVIEKVLVRE